MPAPVGYTTVSGNLADASGVPVTNATIFFQPCNNQGVPISFSVDGAATATELAVSTQVNSGTFSIVLADTALTLPANVGYLVSVVDNVSQQQMLGPGYIIQPSGATWTLNTAVPALGALAIIQKGPPGPEGPPGPPNAGVGNNNHGEIPAGAIDGVNKVFTTMHAPVIRWLFRNGIFQTPGVDYTPSGTSFTYLVAMAAAVNGAPADQHFILYTF